MVHCFTQLSSQVKLLSVFLGLSLTNLEILVSRALFFNYTVHLAVVIIVDNNSREIKHP